MTIREITALRKSGRLEEAISAAKNEFAHNKNIYTAGALFWCLKDLAMHYSGDELVPIIETMTELYNDYCSGDPYMQNSLASLSQRALPHYSEILDAINKAKNNQSVNAEYRVIDELFKAGELDARLYNDFGWLTYYALKQTPLDDAHTRKELLHNYIMLDLPKPTILHSRILDEAIKVEHNTPLQFRIRDFVRLWGMNNLRDQDWEQFRTNDGNTYPSIVERLISVYAKELKTDGAEATDDFNNLVDEALIKYPHNQNMPYYKATVLISQGKKQEALAYYKDLILRFPSKYYLWQQSAELVDDADTRIGLLCKALSCGADDEFLGGVRMKLASLLIQKGMQPNAKFELEKYRQTYQAKGWNLKPEFVNTYSTLANIEQAESNNALYAKYALKADELIYSNIPTMLAVKADETLTEDRKRPGRQIAVWFLRTADTTIKLRKPTKYGLNRRTPNGAPFDVKVLDDKIVWIKEHEGAISEPWLKTDTGEVRLRINRNGRKFAIVADSYIGEKLLRGIRDGQVITLCSTRQDDGSWRAISISNP